MSRQASPAFLQGTTIRIGIGAPLSGSSAVLGMEMKQAVELATDEKNASGGILGGTIVSETIDDKGDASMGVTVARQFSEMQDLLGVIGHYNSDVTIAASPTYEASQLAVITPIASNPAVTDGKRRTVFRYTNRDDQTAAVIAEYLYHVRTKRRAIVVQTSTAYGGSMAGEFTRAFAGLGGEIAARYTVRDGEREFGALVGAFPPDFDLLFYGGSFEGAYILRAMRAAGLDALFAAGDGCWDRKNFLEPAGDACARGEGVLILSATAEVGHIPGSQGIADRYQQRFGPIGNYALNSYDSANILLDAIEQSARATGGVPRRQDVVTALREVKFQGIAYPNPLEWNDKGDNLAAVTALNVVDQGRFRVVAEIPRSG